MRAYNRFVVDQQIDCEVDGRTAETMLYNLSSGGCMIECAGMDLVEGSEIVVHLNQRAAIPGRVVWQIDGNAGIKFTAPLHTKVVHAMGFPEGEDFDAHDPRDRFGIPLVGHHGDIEPAELPGRQAF